MKKNTIVIKNHVNVRIEKVAAGTITPGHLVELTSADKVQVHSVASGNALPMFALECEMVGKSIDDNYVADDFVTVAIPTRGDVVYAKLKDGQNVVIGDKLESAGDGTLQKHVPDSTGDIYVNAIVGIALEAVDMSGSAGVDPSGRIQVLIN